VRLFSGFWSLGLCWCRRQGGCRIRIRIGYSGRRRGGISLRLGESGLGCRADLAAVRAVRCHEPVILTTIGEDFDVICSACLCSLNGCPAAKFIDECDQVFLGAALFLPSKG